MKEIKEHKVYELLNTQYQRVCLDYVILKIDQEYEGVKTHKEAIIEAFQILSHRFEMDYTIQMNQMISTQIDIETLLECPNKRISNPLPYWVAFLKPPHGTNYDSSDFIAFHTILFPNKEEMEVYRWNDDFSNYFDEGKEWWGTGLWTAYDRKMGIMTVIGASLTD